MILVDSGFFIALMDRNDALTARADAWSAVVKEPLLVTEYVLVETLNRLSRPAHRPKAHGLAQIIFSDPQYIFLAASPMLLTAGLELHARLDDKEWSLTEHLIPCDASAGCEAGARV